MKAALFRKPNEISVEELPNPKLGREEALVKVKYAGICGTDVHLYHGEHPTAKYPLIPGHEFVGELVEMITDKETDLKIGDYVIAQPIKSCGVCDACIVGRDNVCSKLNILGVHESGCFAEYIKVPAIVDNPCFIYTDKCTTIKDNQPGYISFQV
jgi:threonine dehydrogenase-like Zn-dependent dehydrogenase